MPRLRSLLACPVSRVGSFAPPVGPSLAPASLRLLRGFLRQPASSARLAGAAAGARQLSRNFRLGTLAPILAAASLALTPLSAQATPAGFDHSYARWTEVLRASVRDGGFDYARLKQDRAGLDAVLSALQAVTPDDLAGWSEKQRFAFWINAYNAFCIQKVVDNYPLKSIKRLGGAFGLNSVFDKGFIPMQAHHPDRKNEVLSLNDIEHKILRRQFKDARLHAAINCASKSCPPLRNEAFTAEKLEAQLDEQMRTFVNDPARNRIDPAKKELALSEIFKWFAEDFERDAKSVKEYLIRYATPDKAELIRAAKIGYLEYDWDLNDVPKN